jgi:hypothetical protein
VGLGEVVGIADEGALPCVTGGNQGCTWGRWRRGVLDRGEVSAGDLQGNSVPPWTGWSGGQGVSRYG